MALHAAGCRSGSAAPGSTTSSRGEPSAGAGDVVEADIGPEGGTITSADGVAELALPPGALTATVRFRIGPATNAPPGSLIQPYSIEPSGTTFARPAILSLRSPSITETEEEAPRVAVDEGGRWSALPGGSWVPDANGVTGHLHHLSTYGVVQRLRGRSMREEDGSEPGAPTCWCLPEERRTCCIESKALPRAVQLRALVQRGDRVEDA